MDQVSEDRSPVNIFMRQQSLNKMTQEDFITSTKNESPQSQSHYTTQPISKQSSTKITPSVSFKLEKVMKLDG
jgi:hypothetical protein